MAFVGEFTYISQFFGENNRGIADLVDGFSQAMEERILNPPRTKGKIVESFSRYSFDPDLMVQIQELDKLVYGNVYLPLDETGNVNFQDKSNVTDVINISRQQAFFHKTWNDDYRLRPAVDTPEFRLGLFRATDLLEYAEQLATTRGDLDIVIGRVRRYERGGFEVDEKDYAKIDELELALNLTIIIQKVREIVTTEYDPQDSLSGVNKAVGLAMTPNTYFKEFIAEPVVRRPVQTRASRNKGLSLPWIIGGIAMGLGVVSIGYFALRGDNNPEITSISVQRSTSYSGRRGIPVRQFDSEEGKRISGKIRERLEQATLGLIEPAYDITMPDPVVMDFNENTVMLYQNLIGMPFPAQFDEVILDDNGVPLKLILKDQMGTNKHRYNLEESEILTGCYEAEVVIFTGKVGWVQTERARIGYNSEIKRPYLVMDRGTITFTEEYRRILEQDLNEVQLVNRAYSQTCYGIGEPIPISIADLVLNPKVTELRVMGAPRECKDPLTGTYPGFISIDLDVNNHGKAYADK
ncbi:MAG: hypothetical protein V1740_03590 [Candidatus Woesearchaeota archaeon]